MSLFCKVDDFSANHGQWLKTNEFSTINEGKLIAPGNLRATQDNEGYAQLFDYWLANTYQLRYTVLYSILLIVVYTLFL